MLKSVLLAAVALLALSAPAYAQRATSTSGASNNTTVGTTSGAQSSSVVTNGGNGSSSSSSRSGSSSARTGSSSARSGSSTAAVTVYTGGSTASDPSRSSGSSGTTASGDPQLHYSGSYTVKNTPELIPPGIVGGNPCSIGVSGGVSLPGFGIAGGATWADSGCERRQGAALLFNMGKTNAAVQLMCQDENVRTALRTAGEPCVADLPKTASAETSAVALPVRLAGAAAPLATRPEWCAKARPDTEASRAYVAQQCGS